MPVPPMHNKSAARLKLRPGSKLVLFVAATGLLVAIAYIAARNIHPPRVTFVSAVSDDWGNLLFVSQKKNSLAIVATKDPLSQTIVNFYSSGRKDLIHRDEAGGVYAPLASHAKDCLIFVDLKGREHIFDLKPGAAMGFLRDLIKPKPWDDFNFEPSEDSHWEVVSSFYSFIGDNIVKKSESLLREQSVDPQLLASCYAGYLDRLAQSEFKYPGSIVQFEEDGKTVERNVHDDLDNLHNSDVPGSIVLPVVHGQNDFKQVRADPEDVQIALQKISDPFSSMFGGKQFPAKTGSPKSAAE